MSRAESGAEPPTEFNNNVVYSGGESFRRYCDLWVDRSVLVRFEDFFLGFFFCVGVDFG